MSSTDSHIRVLSMPYYGGACLRVNGAGLSDSYPEGTDAPSTGHGASFYDYFRLAAPPASGDTYETTIESVRYAKVYLRMDGTGLNAQNTKGGIVNLQYDFVGPYEKFRVHQYSDGTVSFESTAHPGVYLSLQMPHTEGLDLKPRFECSYGVGVQEKFQLKEQPQTDCLRVMSYNTHLMEDSFIADGIAKKRIVAVEGPDLLEDRQRRDHIIRKVVMSNADVVSLQEVWNLDWERHCINELRKIYPHSTIGGAYDWGAYIATSGVVLLSKFPIIETFTEKYSGMEFPDNMSYKGVLCCTIDVPEFGQMRIGTTHATTNTGGALCEDLQLLSLRTNLQNEHHKSLPSLMFGDLNVHKNKRAPMHAAFGFHGSNTYAAFDSLQTLRPYGTDCTIDMAHNKFQQFVSPERNTEDPAVLDYFWSKPGTSKLLYPKNIEIPKDWKCTTEKWCWAHNNLGSDMPAVAQSPDRLVVLSRKGENGERALVVYSVMERSTQRWTHGSAKFISSSSPGLIYHENKFHAFYRDPLGNAIFRQTSADGINWVSEPGPGYETGGMVCPVVYNDVVYLFSVDKDGFAGMIYFMRKTGPGWTRENWTAPNGIGITCKGEMSAAVSGGLLCVVSHEGSQGESSGIMTSVRHSHHSDWHHGHRNNMKSSGAPGIVAVGDKFHLYYRHNNGDAIFSAESSDGIEWSSIDHHTLHDACHDGVAPIVYDGQTYLFYSHHDPGLGGYYHHQTLMHTIAGKIDLELSDHYPVIADFEMVNHETKLDIMVHISGSGDTLFTDYTWAGTREMWLQREEYRPVPLEGFRIDSKIANLGLEYMAHLSGTGDTGWVSGGTYIGTRGENRALEGFCIRLTGSEAANYDLTYQAHSGKTDSPVHTQGAFCGVRGHGNIIQAIRLFLRRKN